LITGADAAPCTLAIFTGVNESSSWSVSPPSTLMMTVPPCFTAAASSPATGGSLMELTVIDTVARVLTVFS